MENPGEQQIIVGGLKSGKINRKSWLDKERVVDVFDIKSDAIKTLIELGIEKENLFISDNTKHSYHPGRSGSITLKSEKGPHLAYFGEIHPGIIKNLDCKDKNIFGFEILKNIPEPKQKIKAKQKKFSSFRLSEIRKRFCFCFR